MSDDVDPVGAPPNEESKPPYVGPDRRKNDLVNEARFAAMQEQIDRRIGAVKVDVAEVRKDVAENTAATLRVEEGMKYVIGLVETMRAGGKVLGFVGRVARWAAPLIGSIAAAWALWHGKPPGGL